MDFCSSHKVRLYYRCHLKNYTCKRITVTQSQKAPAEKQSWGKCVYSDLSMLYIWGQYSKWKQKLSPPCNLCRFRKSKKSAWSQILVNLLKALLEVAAQELKARFNRYETPFGARVNWASFSLQIKAGFMRGVALWNLICQTAWWTHVGKATDQK